MDAARPGLFGVGRRVEAGPVFCSGLLIAYALLIAVRMPNILIKGRLWAEEGAIYFFNARVHAWYDALFALRTGYLNLAASIATLMAARLVPLEAAPWVTTGFSLLIQLIPLVLLMTSGVGWLRDRFSLALAALILLIPYGAREIWLNSITSQFHLVLCAVMILAFPARGGAVGVFRLAVLVLAALSGPAACFLLPLFLLRVWRDRSGPRIWQVLALGSMTALQLVLVATHQEEGRALGIGPRLLALVIYQKHILLPLFGFEHTVRLAGDLVEQVRQGVQARVALAISAAVCLGMTGVVVASRDAFIRWMFAGGAVVMAMSYFGALGSKIDLVAVGYGDRYAYAPTAAFSLVLLALAHGAACWRQRVAAGLVVWMVCIGMNEYTLVNDLFADGSTWSEQAAAWRADHSYVVTLWPTSWRYPIGEYP